VWFVFFWGGGGGGGGRGGGRVRTQGHINYNNLYFLMMCGCMLILVIHTKEVRTLSAILAHAEDTFLCCWRFMRKGRYLPVDLVVTWQVLSIILQWLAWGQNCCALWLCNDTAGTTKTQNIYQPLFLVCTAPVSFITLIGMCRPSALIFAASPARAL